MIAIEVEKSYIFSGNIEASEHQIAHEDWTYQFGGLADTLLLKIKCYPTTPVLGLEPHRQS